MKPVPFLQRTYWLFCSTFSIGRTIRFNGGAVYTSYEIGWLRIFRYWRRL